MDSVEVSTGTAAEVDETIALLSRAFAKDPGIRALFGAPALYLSVWVDFALAYGGRAFDYGTADLVTGGGGAALWLPPGVEQDAGALEALILGRVPASSIEANAESHQRLAEYHPKEPHWYLAMLGVDPLRQGEGIGSALLRSRLTKVDEKPMPVFLETSSTTNLPLYERHGFEVMAELPNADGSVSIYPMYRRAK